MPRCIHYAVLTTALNIFGETCHVFIYHLLAMATANNEARLTAAILDFQASDEEEDDHPEPQNKNAKRMQDLVSACNGQGQEANLGNVFDLSLGKSWSEINEISRCCSRYLTV